MRGFQVFSLPALLGYIGTLFFLTIGMWDLPFAPASDAGSIPGIWLIGLLFLFLVITVTSKNRYTFQDMTYLFGGTLYVGFTLHCAMMLRVGDGLGVAYFLFLLLTMWTTDTFAYFVGRALKGPKLWPAISPNKTISGGLGGILGGILVGIVFASTMDFSWGPWIALAALLSVLGQLGDFVESGLKRAFDVKDSGTLLPGHGGVLDRFDSLIFTAPIAYYGIMALVS
jgi:phosphatidate cytidylyltransferase